MAAASTVPGMGTRRLVSEATVLASIPVSTGELPEPATSHPNRGQSLPNATPELGCAGPIDATTAPATMRTAPADIPLLHVRRIADLLVPERDEIDRNSYQSGRRAVRRPASFAESGQRPKPRRETSSPVPAPPLSGKSRPCVGIRPTDAA